jgi:PadR family transcriptional regulator
MPPRDVDLLLGTLDLLVLRAIAWRPMHGYAIVRFLRDGSSGAFDIKDGALYAALHRLAEREWAESEWGLAESGKRARFYRITPAGRRAMRSESARWDAYVAAVKGVMTASPEPA